MMAELVFAAPAAVGLFVGLWRGSRFSAISVVALSIATVVGIAISLAVSDQPIAGQTFFVTLCLAACAGGFVGPALVARRWLALMISVVAAPLLTFLVFVVAISLACGFHGACF